MKKNLQVSISSLMCMTLIACSSGVSSSDSSSSGDNNSAGTGGGGGGGTPNPTPTPSLPSTPGGSPGGITNSQLIGSWQGQCQSAGSQSLTSKLTFNGTNSVNDVTLVYANGTCTGDVMVTVKVTGTYTLGGLNSKVSGATDVVFVVGAVTATPMEDYVAGQLNFTAYCGYTDWQGKKAHNVSLNNACLAGLPLMGNQIAQITSNKLYFGNSKQTAIDKTVGYTKQ